MRTIVGAIAVLGLAVTVANAQPPRERGATFRPPEAVQPSDLSRTARGAADEFPSSFLPGTPVARPNTAARGPGLAGPVWLTSPDPKVVPAAGSLNRAAAALASQAQDDPAHAPKNSDRVKGASTAGSRSQPVEQPTAATPFRGTSATGAPVFAGPPAYRWYGWGSVTPGANQFAPTGQYPKASANWYSITGATPGAFPVPVMNPLRAPPGTEPPSYGTARTQPTPQPVVPIAAQPPAPQPQPRPAERPEPVERPEPPRFNPTGESKFSPGLGSSVPAPPVNVPKITPPPVSPVVPEPVATREPAPIPFPPAKPEPIVTLPPPVISPILPPSVPLVAPASPVTVTPPSPLPTAMTDEPKPEQPARVEVKPEPPKREEHQWQPATESRQPSPGTWTPAGTPSPQPPPPPPVQPTSEDPGWKSSGANAKPVVTRAQMPDTSPDPVVALIRQICQGRAEGVEVRWTGTKKLSVCFEVRTAAEAQRLVADISRRPELAPYQIDFCAVVK